METYPIFVNLVQSLQDLKISLAYAFTSGRAHISPSTDTEQPIKRAILKCIMLMKLYIPLTLDEVPKSLYRISLNLLRLFDNYCSCLVMYNNYVDVLDI
jgi:hypothetical protein